MTGLIYHVLLVASKHLLKCLVSVIIEFLTSYAYDKLASLHTYTSCFRLQTLVENNTIT